LEQNYSLYIACCVGVRAAYGDAPWLEMGEGVRVGLTSPWDLAEAVWDHPIPYGTAAPADGMNPLG